MAEAYCPTRKGMCDPTKCNREGCEWRDKKWSVDNLAKVAMTTPQWRLDQIDEENTKKSKS